MSVILECNLTCFLVLIKRYINTRMIKFLISVAPRLTVNDIEKLVSELIFSY